MLYKHFDLEREVEQVVGQAVVAEAGSTGLGLVVDAFLAVFASPGCFEPLADLGVGEADHSGLVEVVNDLAVETVAVNGHRLEVALVEEGADQAGHVILSRLQGEKGGRLIWLAEARILGDQRPEEIHRLLGQAADGGDCYLPAGPHGRAAEGFVVRRGQRALGREHQDRPGADTRVEQVEETPDTGGGLAGTGWAFQEDLVLNGALDERQLLICQRERCHSC